VGTTNERKEIMLSLLTSVVLGLSLVADANQDAATRRKRW
jgi:hypothetical protein